ncbi:MAG: S41 family peptidase [Alsobacter sp.]
MLKIPMLPLGAVIGAGAVLMIASGPSPMVRDAVAAASDTYRQLNLFGDVFEKVRADYVEKPDETKLIQSAIEGMLSGLDPHSSYMDAKSFGDMQVQTRGEFGGVGLEVTQEDGVIKVVTPIDGSPAAKAGLMAGDTILQIDGEDAKGLTLNQAVDKMRGPIKSTVKLQVGRKGRNEPLEVKLTRDIIQVKSVRSRAEDDVGYIRITQFTENTADGLKEAIENLRKTIPAEKLKGFVLDLRNNPGGLLDQAVAVCDDLLDRGEIVSTRGRNDDDMQRYAARSKPADLTGDKPLMVLINGGSASASEIVAGALQDHRRATVIGTRSFGKGSVQTIIPLGGQNGALRLTTARYYTPSGRSIQAKGIVPDLPVENEVPKELQGKDSLQGEASLKGHLKNGDEEQNGSSAYVPAETKDDKQLTLALDLLRGVKVNEAGTIRDNTVQPN